MKVQLLKTIKLVENNKRFAFKRGNKYDAQVAYTQPDFDKKGLVLITKKTGESALISKTDYKLIPQEPDEKTMKYKPAQINNLLEKDIILYAAMKNFAHSKSITKLSGKVQKPNNEYIIGENGCILYFRAEHVDFINYNGTIPEVYISY